MSEKMTEGSAVEVNDEIKVLDHGYVKLIDSMGTDETIIEAARMSTGKGFQGWDKDAALLEYLYSNAHMTPFEMCELAIEVQAPIMVFREWHRHRTQSYSELSARYTVMPDLHYLPSVGRVQRQAESNKQGSGESFPPEEAARFSNNAEREQKLVYDAYVAWTGMGVAKEVARINTPVSRYSRMRAKTDLRNWLGFLLLRLAPNAQWEIRQYAEAVAAIVKEKWPRTWGLFEEYDLNAVKFSRTEMFWLRALVSQLPSYRIPDVPIMSAAHRKKLKVFADKLGVSRMREE